MREGSCILFAGQAIQAQGMGVDLWAYPEARGVLRRLEPILGDDLTHVTTEMADEELSLTVHAQRAIHAHHLGCWAVLAARRPDVLVTGAAGHSMGIVAALVVAGAMSMEDSARFILTRARAFAGVCSGTPDGGLAAVSGEDMSGWLDTIAAFPGISVALHNSLGKVVIGGSSSALLELQTVATREGWPLRLQRLAVQGAYHTGAFAACRELLAAALAEIHVAEPRIPVFMGTSGAMESDPERIKRLLVEQPCSTERHLSAICAAYEKGFRTFVEVSVNPQPIHWIQDQLVDEAGLPLPGVTTLPLKLSLL